MISNIKKRILVVDILNQLIRAHCKIDIINEQGQFIGGAVGFFRILGHIIRNTKPDKVFCCIDGRNGSVRRRRIYKDYKEGRTPIKGVYTHRYIGNGENSTIIDEKDIIEREAMFVIDVLKQLPVTYIEIDNLECDDVIGYLTYYFKEDKENIVIIASSDKDYYQLLNDNVIIYNPQRRTFYSQQDLYEEFGIKNPVNFLYLRTIVGDDSDNIHGIKGLGYKNTKRYFPQLYENENPIDYNEFVQMIEANEKYKDYVNTIRINYQLMQLIEPTALLSGCDVDMLLQHIKQSETNRNRFINNWEILNIEKKYHVYGIFEELKKNNYFSVL